MSKSEKITSTKKRRPLRKLLFLAALTGIGVAIKNALEDKGGSYEAPAAQPSSAPVPTPPVPTVETAETVVEKRPVENLDEFADPVEPDVDPESEGAADASDEPAAPAKDDAPLKRGPRTEPPTARTLASAESPEELRSIEDVDVPGKIDPFGIR